MRHKSLSMNILPLRNIPFKDPTLPIGCNHNNHKSQNHIKVFPYLLIPMKDIIYYYLLIRYYIIWTLLFVIEIPYYDFVIYDLCDCLCPLFVFVKIQNIIKNAKSQTCEKILFTP